MFGENEHFPKFVTSASVSDGNNVFLANVVFLLNGKGKCLTILAHNP